MTAYTRRNLGGKLFVIDWNLVVAGGVSDVGTVFENDGAELLSITGQSDSGVLVTLNFGNTLTGHSVINVSGTLFVPVAPGFEPAISPVPVLPPTVWRYQIQAEADPSNGAAHVGLLFKQL
jgi:hypothetical protein